MFAHCAVGGGRGGRYCSRVGRDLWPVKQKYEEVLLLNNPHQVFIVLSRPAEFQLSLGLIL